jgi:uncharacterized protein with von Willebrand factor type A (vWA) domain
MRYCSELMLSLVYSLQDLVTKTHAFAFIDHLEYISPDFAGQAKPTKPSRRAVRMPPGYYSTDMGYALEGFAQDYMDTVDRRTTVIVVGDGRNNYNNPRTGDLRAKWRVAPPHDLDQPEPPMLWGSGDSDMLQYAPLCNNVVMAATLAELTDAVDELLAQP